jgi:penicillin-binding protein 1C
LLSDTAARHRRFGRGLPIELASGAQVVAKTGTASGMCDASAILASREFLVGAWSGRFDGAPTRGMSGMWGAGPLARRALELALQGRAPTLPSSELPVPASVTRHAAEGGDARAAATRDVPRPLTAEIEAWAGRARALGPRSPHTRR